jgi:hypothetical protein
MSVSILSSLAGNVYVAQVSPEDCAQAAREGREYAQDRLSRGEEGRMPWVLDTYVQEGYSPAAALFLSRIFARAAMAVLMADLTGGNADDAGEDADVEMDSDATSDGLRFGVGDSSLGDGLGGAEDGEGRAAA